MPPPARQTRVVSGLDSAPAAAVPGVVPLASMMTAPPSGLRVALIRHPPARIAAGLCYGRLDLGLAPGAAERVTALAAALRAFPARRIWTSPARRCAEPAAMLGAALELAPVADPRLLELDFGAWEGLAWDAVPRAALDRWAADPLGFAPPGGESGAALITRVRGFAATLRARGEDCVVVAHGGPLRLLPALLRGEAPDLLAPAPAQGALTFVEAVAFPGPAPEQA